MRVEAKGSEHGVCVRVVCLRVGVGGGVVKKHVKHLDAAEELLTVRTMVSLIELKTHERMHARTIWQDCDFESETANHQLHAAATLQP